MSLKLSIPSEAILTQSDRLKRQASTLDADTLAACRRAARALTAHLRTCGERPLTFPQVNLIRAIQLAESATGRAPRDACDVIATVAHFFTSRQTDFAVELLTEGLHEEQAGAWAILDELEAITRHGQDAGAGVSGFHFKCLFETANREDPDCRNARGRLQLNTCFK